MNKQEMLDEIAKKHKIILDENDPIFAIVTANEMLFNDFLSKLDKYFIKQKADLESYKTSILKELKDYTDQTKTSLSNIEYAIPAKDENQTIFHEKKASRNTFLLIAATEIIFLLVGLIIGIVI
ncbi:conjugal transfer protein TraM, partial [Campylobacter fetus subsp. testudinum]|uniref:conjugal transfer protein TraM n=1 Tax=Campylobacter fetus TaxID=196 RepID=UPI0008187F9B